MIVIVHKFKQLVANAKPLQYHDSTSYRRQKKIPFSKLWPMGKSLHTVYDRHTIAFFEDLEDLIDVEI